MASGKSVVAEKLSQLLGFRFVDTDKWIEARCCKSISEIFSLTRDTSKEDITKATLESVAFQSKDLVEAMKKDKATFKKLMIDGGMVNNNWFCQQLANTLQVEVSRPAIIETTSLGAAFLACLKADLYEDLSSLKETKVIDKVFIPKAEEDRYHEWKAAVKKVLVK